MASSLYRLAGRTAAKVVRPLVSTSTTSMASRRAPFSAAARLRYAELAYEGTRLVPVDGDFNPAPSEDPYGISRLADGSMKTPPPPEDSVEGRKVRHYTVNFG